MLAHFLLGDEPVMIFVKYFKCYVSFWFAFAWNWRVVFWNRFSKKFFFCNQSVDASKKRVFMWIDDLIKIIRTKSHLDKLIYLPIFVFVYYLYQIWYFVLRNPITFEDSTIFLHWYYTISINVCILSKNCFISYDSIFQFHKTFPRETCYYSIRNKLLPEKPFP